MQHSPAPYNWVYWLSLKQSRPFLLLPLVNSGHCVPVQNIIGLLLWDRDYTRKSNHSEIQEFGLLPRDVLAIHKYHAVQSTQSWMLHYKVAVKIFTSYPFSEPALYRVVRGYCRNRICCHNHRLVSMRRRYAQRGFVSVLTCQSTAVNRTKTNRKTLLGQVKDFEKLRDSVLSCFQAFG